ncbi:uncharacterized protein FIESC28_05736 [Fusarium coffeatum]|uniref:BZIP domain-containing protein n=1 Tax=Fusarium coffeatum TaxID=231269 RepID=A0A366RRW1_9HYPO|nr:uncharacterized protein FIESC28_05736 [Fusarium coffeatum]RBR19065.1 hypothetical protein FIESC28_05736 [Fusarium coffeatum]
MVQDRTRVSQLSTNTSQPSQNGSGSSAIKKKVVRRDPEKRRMQNRLAQQTYREKQRKRIQELERRAAEHDTEVKDSDGSIEEVHPVGYNSTTKSAGGFLLDAETVNPSDLYNGLDTTVSHQSTAHVETWDSDIIHEDFDKWLIANPIYDEHTTPAVFFNCGCPTLHVPNTSMEVLLPVIPNPYKNNLQMDIICIISAMLENCLSLGITRSMYCAEEAVSPFFRAHVQEDPSSQAIVASVQRGARGLHFDLRPTQTQIVTDHHPFIDTIPFKEVRDNIIKYMSSDEEDEFFHDSLNHLTCWGGINGAHTGTPWDARSWEATEEFIQKWSNIVGGEEGELARNSQWWRSLRGERTITEIM